MKKLVFLIVLGLLAINSKAQNLLLNEILVNPPGTDNPFEFIELKGTPGSTINSSYLVVFESDSGTAGNSDLVIRLNGITMPASGIYVIGTSLGYTFPSSALVRDTLIFGLPGGILENGSISFMLFYSPIPFVYNYDYDANNDGVLELPAGAAVLDAVGWDNGSGTAHIYGGVSLTQAAGTPDCAVRFYNNTTPSSLSAWYNGDLNGTSPAFTFDPLEVSSNFPAGAGVTPGFTNLPNPAAVSNISKPLQITVYPNATYDYCFIQSNYFTPGFTIEVLNLYGERVLIERITSQNHKLDLSNFSNGMYTIKIGDSLSAVTKKIIKL